MAFRHLLFKQAFTSKFRFILGYGIVITLLLFLMTANISSIPGGLSEAEMNQAVTSSAIDFKPTFNWTVDGLYNIIQKISIESLGLSRVSLVLPSLIFGSLTVILFALTMKHWFRDSVAVVATAIFTTSVPFTVMLRQGTPDIMLPFWTMLLLFAAVNLLVKKKRAFYWKLMIAIATIGLLYTPLGIYPIIGIFSSALLHPHVRSRIRHMKQVRVAIIGLVFLIGIAPLLVNIVLHPSVMAKLTGWDAIVSSFTHLRLNLAQIYDLYFNFRKNGFSATIIVPLFNLATIALAILGFFKCVKDRYTAKSYVLITWSFVTAVVIFFMPSNLALVLIPISILMAIGIDTLIVEWYSLFPRNPYARVAGLIPLTILFISVAAGNISHYFNNHKHIPNPFYSQSLVAVQKSLVIEGNHNVTLVTKPEEVDFYSLLKKDFDRLSVTSEIPASITVPTLVIPNVEYNAPTKPSRILASSLKDDGVALRVYRP